MKIIVKRQYQELVEYVDFPMIIYIYETGKIIASNRSAKDIIGDECKNMNSLWDNHTRVRYPKEVLDNGNAAYLGRTIISGKDSIKVDIEVTSMVLDNQHIIICLMNQSYRQQPLIYISKFVPRIVWKDKRLNFIGGNYHYREDWKKWNSESNKESMVFVNERFLEEDKSTISSKASQFNVIHQVNEKDKEVCFIKMHRMPIINKNGTCIGVICIYNYILSRKDHNQMLDFTLRLNKILNETVSKSDSIVLSCAVVKDYPVEYISSNIEKYGYNMNDFIIGNLTWKDVVHPDDYERIYQEELKLNVIGADRSVKEYRIVTAEGKAIWVSEEIIYIVKNKKNSYRESIITQIAFKNYDNMALYSEKSYIDYLTSLPNRLKFESDIVKCIDLAIENNRCGYILSFDLDDFRNINDQLGYKYGDILLKNIARYLTEIPQIKDYCYRIGGDEFLIILTDQFGMQVDQIITLIFEGFRKPWRLYGKESYCTMSMGISRFPTDSSCPNELLRLTDLAQAEAKKEGKNRISYYKTKKPIKSIKRINMEKYLRKAIISDCLEFEIFYQPIVGKDKAVIGAEALLRWRSPELGFIDPMEFIPLSEYLGLNIPLGEFVMRKAFIMCKYINDNIDPTFTMNINLSVVQLTQPDIVQSILEITRQIDVKKSNIVFEIEEKISTQDKKLVQDILRIMKEQGFKIALADVGTSFSLLDCIAGMPLEYIKINNNLMLKYGCQEYISNIVMSVIEFAHKMNMEVITVGVETEEQVEFLKSLGVDKFQGFLYGRAIQRDEFLVNIL
jgi:diguanylate cyclase (GGDEF)-like protein